MLYKLSAVGFVIHGTLGWMPLGTQEEHEKQVLASASAQSSGADKTDPQRSWQGWCCGYSEELREGRKAGLGIQMMLSGGDRILAGPGRMGRQTIKLRLSFWERET